MPKNPWAAPIQPVRSQTFSRCAILGPLTDRKIEKYAADGWYSEEFRKARRELRNKKKRVGNFLECQDGRFIYSPL